MKEYRKFKKGEFLTNTNKPGSFVIFEGIEDESCSTMKKYSTLVSYDPSKYRENPNGGGWITSPYLDVSTNAIRCTQTVDGDTNSYWWRPCTQQEIEKAISILNDYGYYWNEDMLSIIAKDTGEIVSTVAEPKLEYNGEVVKPISQKFKELLSKVCHGIIEKKYSYRTTYYSGYAGFWDEEYWD